MIGIQRAKNLTGVAVPMSPAGAALGLGDMLGQQVTDETEETRRKRMLAQQQQMSPATASLLGGII